MPIFLIEHAVTITTVVTIAAFCFKYREPHRPL